MPLYAFHCQDCAQDFETLARFEETPQCPACGGAHVERLLSLIAKPAAGGDTAGDSCAAMAGGTPCPSCPAFAN